MSGADVSGVLKWYREYAFAEGGVVETAVLQPGALPFEVSRWEVGPGQRNDLEAHASVELWLIAQGEGVVTLDGAETRVRLGDAVVIRPQVWHQLFNDGTERVRAVSVYWRPRRSN